MSLGGVVVLGASGALALMPLNAPAAGAAPAPQTVTTPSATTGVPALDAELAAIEAALSGVEGNVSGELATVTGELDSVGYIASDVAQLVICLPQVLETQINHAPPGCDP
jgi:hypothetical protein